MSVVHKTPSVLFICTGNSCRSQMAEGWLRKLSRGRYKAYSAGTTPSRVHQMAIAVMEESGVDISTQTSDPIDKYLAMDIDFVFTLCDNAAETCPVFPGAKTVEHWGLDDPFRGWEFDENQLHEYRKTRDIIKEKIENFLKEQ